MIGRDESNASNLPCIKDERRRKIMIKAAALLVLVFLTAWTGLLQPANSSEDLPIPTMAKDAGSYEEALQLWKAPEDINAWVGVNFIYDKARAIRLSETQRRKNDRFSIYKPSELFANKTGVCIDLSRFGVETLRIIYPQGDPKYLLIEFDPIQIKGNNLRFHWLVSFRRKGGIYFFCDSNRPGCLSGPYANKEAFVHAYEQYRARRIVSVRELETYLKQKRTQRQEQKKPE